MLRSELLRTTPLKGKGAEAFEEGGEAFIRFDSTAVLLRNVKYDGSSVEVPPFAVPIPM
jgi:hypothetical protein